MFKYAIVVAIAVSASASAQVTQPDVIKPVTAEKAKTSQSDDQYCIYEDKKYTEGAVKKADGVLLVCLREGFSTYKPGSTATPPLVWQRNFAAR
jgi:hypothetical protein